MASDAGPPEAVGSPIIVAIDGPSGVGKSSVARQLAARLGLPFVDTGAMYRCVAWLALQKGVDRNDPDAMARLARETRLSLLRASNGATELRLDGRTVGEEIRSSEVSMATSDVARHPGVRLQLLEVQREFGRSFGGVLEGRDIGSVVFPETPYKFFLDAAPGVRAERRSLQLAERGQVVDRTRLEHELALRDRQDSERKASPLRRDPTYRAVDTSCMSEAQVVDHLVKLVEEIRAQHGAESPARG